MIVGGLVGRGGLGASGKVFEALGGFEVGMGGLMELIVGSEWGRV